MPMRLRPTAPLAADAILVGDPGRALLLAQELLAKPKMSNHARGLWGYSGEALSGRPLTIQSTGMGGPSAAIVLADLAEAGLRRAVRIGTATALDPAVRPGELLLVAKAAAGVGSGASFGVPAGDSVLPDGGLTDRLRSELGDDARRAAVVSVDSPPRRAVGPPAGAAAADMQTVAVLARADALAVAAAALLIVTEDAAGGQLAEVDLENVAKHTGRTAMAVLST